MRSRIAIFFAFTVSTAMAIGTAMAADMPKEGTYNATYTSSGMLKIIPVGKERVFLIISDENGQTVSNGFLDHVTWRCWGMGDHRNGVGPDYGSCVATDTSGDQVVDDWRTEDYKFGQKLIKLTDRFTTGTGKYAGITGGGTSVIDTGFRPPEGMFTVRAQMQGAYKLP